MDKPANPYADIYGSFLKQTKNHELAVIHDDGLYRHLRIQDPNTRIWSWDIITWPGHLATSGDIANGYMFDRETDMVKFFSSAGKSNHYFSDGAPSIDFRYWAEKLTGRPSGDTRRYDSDMFLRRVRDDLNQHDELGIEAQKTYEKKLALLGRIHVMRGLNHVARQHELDTFQQTKLRTPDINAHRRAAYTLWSTDEISDDDHKLLERDPDYPEFADTDIEWVSPVERRGEILAEARLHSDDESSAYEWLQDNDEIFGDNTWEWDLREWDIHFIFACYCIEWGVRLYFKHLAELDTTHIATRKTNHA